MKQALLLGVLILLSALGVRQLYLAFASDETKIRWAVERMCGGYNRGDVGDCMASIADDWRHAPSPNVTRERLAYGLTGQILSDGQSRRGRLVEIPEDSLTIDVDGDRASVACEAFFYSVRDEQRTLHWQVRLESDWRDGDDGWEIFRSDHLSLEGHYRP